MRWCWNATLCVQATQDTCNEPSMPIWKDEASECEEMGRRADGTCGLVLVTWSECSSVRSESCWGETDIDEHEDVEWGTLPQPTVSVSERVAQSVAHQGRSPVHVVRHSLETVAASLLDEQIHSVVPRVIVGEVRQVVVDTDGREEQSWEGASPILSATEALEFDFTRQDSSDDAANKGTPATGGSRSRTLAGDV